MAITPAALRLDLKCGRGAISAGEKCTKGTATKRRVVKTAAKIALGAGAAAGLTAGAIYAAKRRYAVTPVRVTVMPPAHLTPGSVRPALPGDRTTRALRAERGTRQLRGTTPYGLLPPSPPRLGRTGRLRANTGAAVRRAERRIAQTARAEVQRVAQIGNTMAAAGEATGMAAKTTLRELRLRAEAARRRWEPGYRRPDPPRTQSQLPAAPEAEPVRFPIRPRRTSPARIRIRRTDTAGLTPGKLQS